MDSRAKEFLTNYIGKDNVNFESFLSILNGYDGWLQTDENEQARVIQYMNDSGVMRKSTTPNVDVKKYLVVLLTCKHKLKPVTIERMTGIDHALVSFYARSFLDIHGTNSFRNHCREVIRLFPLDFKYAIVSLEYKYNKKKSRVVKKEITLSRQAEDVIMKFKKIEDIHIFSTAVNKYIIRADESMG